MLSPSSWTASYIVDFVFLVNCNVISSIACGDVFIPLKFGIVSIGEGENTHYRNRNDVNHSVLKIALARLSFLFLIGRYVFMMISVFNWECLVAQIDQRMCKLSCD